MATFTFNDFRKVLKKTDFEIAALRSHDKRNEIASSFRSLR